MREAYGQVVEAAERYVAAPDRPTFEAFLAVAQPFAERDAAVFALIELLTHLDPESPWVGQAEELAGLLAELRAAAV